VVSIEETAGFIFAGIGLSPNLHHGIVIFVSLTGRRGRVVGNASYSGDAEFKSQPEDKLS
jgi:hypothetical protein